MYSSSSSSVSSEDENNNENLVRSAPLIKSRGVSIYKVFIPRPVKKPKENERRVKLNNPALIRLSTAVYRRAAKVSIKKLQRELLPKRLRKSEISTLQGELDDFLKRSRQRIPELEIPTRKRSGREYIASRENLEEEVDELEAKEKVYRKIQSYLLDELKAKKEKVANLQDVVLKRLQADVQSFQYSQLSGLPKKYEYANKNADLQRKPDAFGIFEKKNAPPPVEQEDKKTALELFLSDKVKAGSKVFLV